MIKHIPAEQYHADTDWVSNSMLKVLNDSRRKFEAQFITKTLPASRSKSMDLGTVGHAAILEPHIIADVCREIPAEVLNKDGHRKGAEWLKWQDANADKILMTAQELAKVRGMFESVYRHKIARRLLEAEGKCEASCYWECLETGLKRRCRWDKVAPSSGWVVDVKTTHNVAKHKWASTMHDYSYAQQAAFYSHAYEAEFNGEVPKFCFIAVEPEPPYLCRVYGLPERAATLGDSLVWQGLETLRECMDSGDWSDPEEQEIVEVDLPFYAYKDRE
jgi:hypothetical protein